MQLNYITLRNAAVEFVEYRMSGRMSGGGGRGEVEEKEK